jgi:hypothetical protein
MNFILWTMENSS